MFETTVHFKDGGETFNSVIWVRIIFTIDYSADYFLDSVICSFKVKQKKEKKSSLPRAEMTSSNYIFFFYVCLFPNPNPKIRLDDKKQPAATYGQL